MVTITDPMEHVVLQVVAMGTMNLLSQILRHRAILLHTLLEVLHRCLHLLLELINTKVVLDEEGVELAEGYGHLGIPVTQVFYLKLQLPDALILLGAGLLEHTKSRTEQVESSTQLPNLFLTSIQTKLHSIEALVDLVEALGCLRIVGLDSVSQRVMVLHRPLKRRERSGQHIP